MKKIIVPIALTSCLWASECATQQTLPTDNALTRFQPVATLRAAVAAADQQSLSLLAPETYNKALTALQTANKQTQQNDPSANATALQGQRLLERAQSQRTLARDVFAEVLAARESAINSGATLYAPAEMNALDNDLQTLARKLAQGDEDAAKIRRPELIRRYAAAEMTALKTATIDRAKKALAKARAHEAHKHAQKTFALAENELAIAVKLIEGDKSRKAAAQQHAERTIALSEQAIGITDTVKAFRQNDFTYEEMVLWHQEQLQKAVEPLNPALSMNRPQHHIIADIHADIEALIQARDTLATVQTNQEKQAALAAANRQKLAFIQNLFEAKEASVYRQKDDVLIRAQGFYFPVGQSEIDSTNFSLLHKIAQAISHYPNATIYVTGHTDNTGRNDKNLTLSRDRARKVAKFLNEFGGIAADRIRVNGYGAGKPVASNDTPAGRAANRRVEILIQNKG